MQRGNLPNGRQLQAALTNLLNSALKHWSRSESIWKQPRLRNLPKKQEWNYHFFFFFFLTVEHREENGKGRSEIFTFTCMARKSNSNFWTWTLLKEAFERGTLHARSPHRTAPSCVGQRSPAGGGCLPVGLEGSSPGRECGLWVGITWLGITWLGECSRLPAAAGWNVAVCRACNWGKMGCVRRETFTGWEGARWWLRYFWMETPLPLLFCWRLVAGLCSEKCDESRMELQECAYQAKNSSFYLSYNFRPSSVALWGWECAKR